jgi:hypothetical protein
MVVRVVPSVNSDRKFQAVALALRLMDKELRKDVNKATRDTLGPEWKKLVEQEAFTAGNAAILSPGTRIQAGNPPVAKAAGSVRKLSGGGRPADLAHLAEFGSGNPERFSKPYDRKNRSTGGTHKVRRRTLRQFGPRVREGKAVYPAFAELAPRAAALWAQIVVRTTHEAFEKGD